MRRWKALVPPRSFTCSAHVGCAAFACGSTDVQVLRRQQGGGAPLPAGRPVRIVAAPSQSSRHQHRPHTSLAHHAQQLWPGMEHGHAAAPPSQREQLLRQAQAAEGAQPRRQQRRPGQPGGTWGPAEAACRHTAPMDRTVGSQRLREQASGPHICLLLSGRGFTLSAQVPDVRLPN